MIGEAGGGVYYVGSRDSWYPRRGDGFTSFDLRFRYPKKLDLVATGKLIETTSGEDTRSSHFHTQTPIRVAGFNLEFTNEFPVKSATTQSKFVRMRVWKGACNRR